MTKEYSTRWFEEDAQPIWEQHILPRKDLINTYLEIGCGGGDSACWVLDNLGVEKAIPLVRRQLARAGEQVVEPLRGVPHRLISRKSHARACSQAR